MNQALPLLVVTFFFLVACLAATPAGGNQRPYIVQMDVSAMPTPFTTHESWYASVLSSLGGKNEEAAPERLYTYAHAMNGFSAVLTARQLAKIQGMAVHVSVFPETYARLHTTRTPEFLGLVGGIGSVWPASKYGEDVIIGIVDTGV